MTLVNINKNIGTLTGIPKSGEASYLLTDNDERILVGATETDELILAESNQLTNIAKNV